jgi:hypothetical protein
MRVAHFEGKPMANKISITDDPVRTAENGGDKLETGPYAKTLGRFILDCETPLTIGVQGEWGSGKTSILNMIKEVIEVPVPRRGGATSVSRSIWVDTWEHSLMKTPEECLLSIIEQLINEITRIDGSYDSAQKAKSALAAIARGAIKIGASATLGATAANVAGEMMQTDSKNNIAQMREALQLIVSQVLEKNSSPKIDRIVVFVDDLDRLEPSIAVQILELIKNIFNIDGCVFVLAIDYQVVVKGLKGKFGEPSPENEWEFRAFFDKIIQVPFMMPMSKYNLNKYINDILIDDIQYFKKSDMKRIRDGTLARIVKMTLGNNPRSMKRLLNTLSLLKMHHESEMNDNFRLRQTIFSLVCLQISFPKIFELLIKNPDFPNWDRDFEEKCLQTDLPPDEAALQALKRAQLLNDEDFDEDWEITVFRIVWAKKWQKSRIVDISRVLSIIKDDIFFLSNEDEFIAEFTASLKITSVTAVTSIEEPSMAEKDFDPEDQITKERMAFWAKFVVAMEGTGTVFDSFNVNTKPVRRSYSARRLERALNTEILDVGIRIGASTSSTRPLSVEVQSEDEILIKMIVKHILNHRSSIFADLKVEVYEDKDKAGLTLFPLWPDFKKRTRMEDAENHEFTARVITWMAESLRQVEVGLMGAIKDVSENKFQDPSEVKLPENPAALPTV